MIILDTDVVSILQRSGGPDYDRVIGHMRQYGNPVLVTTVITYEEQMRGWFKFIVKAAKDKDEVSAYARLTKFIDYYRDEPLLAFDHQAAERFEALRKRLRGGSMDLKIASIALSRDVPLATRNVLDFEQVPGLKLLDWSR